jgi:hypothetical protein
MMDFKKKAKAGLACNQTLPMKENKRMGDREMGCQGE